jgi:hypothetical protein
VRSVALASHVLVYGVAASLHGDAVVVDHGLVGI